MSLLSTSKQFQLFDFTPIQDPNYQTKDALYSDPTLSSINASKTFLILAVNNCQLKIVNCKELITLGKFQAYDQEYNITYVEPLHNSNNLILTLGEKQGSPSILKLWDLTKMLNLIQEDTKWDEFQYKFQTQVLVNLSDNSYPISCLKFNYDLSCIAIGYTHGKVLLIRGDLLRDRGAKQRIIYESNNNDPITNIQFVDEQVENSLYVTTTSKILIIPTTGRNNGKPLRTLSNKTGVDLNCSDVNQEFEMIVGLPESIRFYNHLNKLSTINFEIPKTQIKKLRNYLLILSPQQQDDKTITRIYVLDLVNLHISLNILIPNTIKTIFIMNSDYNLLSNDGVLYKLHEKPINQQIELILQRELFSVAFNLAKQSDLSIDTLLRIEKLHGDYLFDQGKYDESIEIFIKCLDLYQEEQSKEQEEDMDEFIINIITKFKDAINITNLTKFLQQLYQRSISNLDHITLLLCCYCKIKDINSIDSFINDVNLVDNLQDLNFQLIINLFKECGFYNQVLNLLDKLNQPNLIIDIQLNDLKKPKLALNYMKSLKIDDLLIILIEHCQSLLNSCPIETTELLINVFTGKYKPNSHVDDLNDDKLEKEEKKVELTNYKSFLNYLKNDDGKQVDQELTKPTYSPPKPNLIYSSFTNHPNEFIIFLEACIESFDIFEGNVNDKKQILLTLLELYLSTSKLDKANQLIIQYSTLLDRNSLILLNHIYNFEKDESLADQFDKSILDIDSLFVKYEIEQDLSKLFKLVESHGPDQPQLYVKFLKILIANESLFKSVNEEDLTIIIEQILSFKLLNIIEIVNLLSNVDFVSYGLVKKFLISFFEEQDKEIHNNDKLIEYYEKQTSINSFKLSELEKSSNFKIAQTKCSNCQMKLDYPSVNFKCNHSYHKRCLVGENCPLCYDTSKLNDVHRQDEKLFLSKLHSSDDKMKYLSNNM